MFTPSTRIVLGAGASWSLPADQLSHKVDLSSNQMAISHNHKQSGLSLGYHCISHNHKQSGLSLGYHCISHNHKQSGLSLCQMD